MTQTTHETQSLVIPQGVDDDYHDIEVALMNNYLFLCSLIKDCCSLQCAFGKSTTRTFYKMLAKMSKQAKNLDMECQVITKFICIPYLSLKLSSTKA